MKEPINPRDFAIKAHGDQRYGDRPYAVHLDAVAELVRTVDPSWDALAVAYLHDVVEDTEVTVQDVRVAFGSRVAGAVVGLTDPEGYANRKARKAELHRRLATLDPCAPVPRLTLLVKAADRLANLASSKAEGKAGLLKMYQREHEAFRAAAYRPGLCDDIWAQIDRLVQE